jgi:hypothetical protein
MKRSALAMRLAFLLLLGIACHAVWESGYVVQAQTDPPAKEAPPAAPPPDATVAPDGGDAAAAPTYNSALRRYPYLTDVTGPYATINWATVDTSLNGYVRWGQSGVESCTAHTTPASATVILVNRIREYQWQANLNLRPNTRYCYRVYLDSINLLGSDTSPVFWTQLPPSADQGFSFAVFGDWGMVDANGRNPDQANLIAQIARSSARFAVTTGDNGYPAGSQNNYGDLVQVGANLSGVFGRTFWKVAGATLPIFPAIGNHGLDRADTTHPHLVNWPQDRTVAASGGIYARETYCCLNGTQPGGYPSAWYAFDAGGARFYVLDAAWDDANLGTGTDYANDYAYHWQPGSEEYQWLARDLAAYPGTLKFAFLHYPFYSDDSTEPSDPYLQGAGSLEGLLARNGVGIAFSGHAHIYQRNLPVNGLVSYVTGGGGGDVVPVGGRGCSAMDAYAIGWSYSNARGSACGSAPVPTSLSQVYHYLLVTVNGSQVRVAPTDSRGRTFDVRSYNFSSPPPAPTPGGGNCGITFRDVGAGQTFAPYIGWMACRGYISGYSCGGPGNPCPGLYFHPTATVTRGQLLKMVVLAAGWPLVNPLVPSFADTPAGSPFYRYIETATRHGIISGYSCGGPGEPCNAPLDRPYFRPGASITRGQLSKVLALARGYPLPNPATPTFRDVPRSQPFFGYIEAMAAHDIVSGYTCGGRGEPCPGAYFRPANSATRGQVTKFITLSYGGP